MVSARLFRSFSTVVGGKVEHERIRMRLELMAGVHRKSSAVLDSYELPARGIGDPASVAGLADVLAQTGILRSWQIKTRWYEHRPEA